MIAGPRIGQGIDVHPFAASSDRPLVLGGVLFPGEPGLAGHSDSDVVLHALADALLGAVARGDIGERFGVADPAFADVDSRVFVDGALADVLEAGWTVGNVDLTVVAQRPKISPRRAELVASVAGILGVSPDAVSVKASTTDGLGFIGRGEGIACFATVLVHREGGDG
ncbi:MAG TPA: 2-C-methyl-D-erythritol 2,4-cyclodiphosphate synthase [Egibacteraceae bacterium]|nr:2-C-methyl-D-erythritol 2,4-cyclodiphosphate synthase [Egibacteraceae bacterium]